VAWTIPWHLIGMQVSGDVGDFSIYTDRFGRKVVYPKAPPEKPPTAAQTARREAFKAAQQSWSALSSEAKANLEEACRVLSMPLTGQNLWISAVMRQDTTAYRTVAAQSGIALPDLPAE